MINQVTLPSEPDFVTTKTVYRFEAGYRPEYGTILVDMVTIEESTAHMWHVVSVHGFKTKKNGQVSEFGSWIRGHTDLEESFWQQHVANRGA